MVNLNNFVKFFIWCHLILLKMDFSEAETRIVNGRPTTIDKAPFLVRLYANGSFYCGGTLISDQFVVTAAHCVYKQKPQWFFVAAGSTIRNDFRITSKVKKIIVPKRYNPDTYYADVAVLKLVHPIAGPTARFCQTSAKHGDTVQVFGWGKLHEEVDYIPLELRTVEVNVVDRELCEQQYPGLIRDTMFCATGPGKDACQFDSGGPALVNGKYCGIVSFGFGCAREYFPGVYTSIPEVLPFIEAAMLK